MTQNQFEQIAEMYSRRDALRRLHTALGDAKAQTYGVTITPADISVIGPSLAYFISNEIDLIDNRVECIEIKGLCENSKSNSEE